jgi:tetratricopeptide (TPR) repeat protein
LRSTADGVAVDALLARAAWLGDDAMEALELTNRVLEVAERLDLVSIVAEAMYVRGGALGDIGRTYEGIPVMEGAMRLAELHGLSQTALRSRNALAGYLMASDPAEALKLYLDGAAEAQRVGDRASMLRLLTNAAIAWFETGDWATALREMETALASPMPAADRTLSLFQVVQIRAYRGDPIEELIRELDDLLEHERDSNVLNAWASTRAAVALADGRYEDARAAAVESARLSSFNAPITLGLSGHAAAWARDRDAVAGTLDALLATRAHGGLVDLRKTSLRAAIAGLDGRVDEAAAGFRTSLEGFRRRGARVEEALTGIDLAAVLGADRADPQLVRATRAVLTELGAAALLARLEDVLDPRRADQIKTDGRRRVPAIQASSGSVRTAGADAEV